MNVEHLIQLNIEIEGLLRVLSNRDNDEARQLLTSKFNEFKTLFDRQFVADQLNAETSVEQSDSEAEQLAEDDAQNELEPETLEVPVMEMPKVEIPIVEPTPMPHYDPEFTTADEIAANRQNEMRVDEMLTCREARDLRKAFTLNDKFRFRRELFANNDALFAETLNLLSAMKNTEEAVEYMRDDLGWDMDNDDVKDFVNIVNNHFA
jgi:hypothetical protein